MIDLQPELDRKTELLTSAAADLPKLTERAIAGDVEAAESMRRLKGRIQFDSDAHQISIRRRTELSAKLHEVHTLATSKTTIQPGVVDPAGRTIQEPIEVPMAELAPVRRRIEERIAEFQQLAAAEIAEMAGTAKRIKEELGTRVKILRDAFTADPELEMVCRLYFGAESDHRLELKRQEETGQTLSRAPYSTYVSALRSAVEARLKVTDAKIRVGDLPEAFAEIHGITARAVRLGTHGHTVTALGGLFSFRKSLQAVSRG